jgi:hypothetical protein
MNRKKGTRNMIDTSTGAIESSNACHMLATDMRSIYLKGEAVEYAFTNDESAYSDALRRTCEHESGDAGAVLAFIW